MDKKEEYQINGFFQITESLINQIENDLLKNYKCIINVKYKSGSLIDVYIYIRQDLQVSFLYLLDNKVSYSKNLYDLSNKIDKEIVNLFRKEEV